MAGEGGGAIRAGQAWVELSARDASLASALERGKKMMQGFGEAVGAIGLGLAAAGAAITAPMGLFLKEFASSGDEVAKSAGRLGIGVSALSELKFAADQSGSSFEELETSLKKMSKAIGEATFGNDELRRTFQVLGVPLERLRTMKPDQQFEAIADALSRIEPPAARMALLLELFGKSGERMGVLVGKGGEGIRRLREEANALGLVLSEGAAKEAENLTEAFRRLDLGLAGVRKNIGAALAPAMLELLENIQPIITQTIAFVKANGELVRSVVKVGGALLVGGIALKALALAVQFTGVKFLFLKAATLAWGLVSTGISLVAGSMVLLHSAVSGVGAAMLAVGAIGTTAFAILTKAAVISSGIIHAVFAPEFLIGAGLIAGIAVVGIALFRMTTSSADALENLASRGRMAWRSLSENGSEAWEVIRATALGAWAGISSAMQRGDLQAAGEIAFTGLKVAVLQGALSLQNMWLDLTDFFGRRWDEMNQDSVESWANTVFKIRSLFIDMIGAVLGQTAKVAEFFKMSGFADRTRQFALDLETKAKDDRNSAIDEAVDTRAANQRKRDEEREASTAGTKGLLDAARATMAELLGEEAKKAPPPGPGGSKNPLGNLGPQLQAGLAIATKGIFQASDFAQVLGVGDSLMEKSLAIQEAMNSNLDKIAENTAGGFGALGA